jgi:hypothetical protein
VTPQRLAIKDSAVLTARHFDWDFHMVFPAILEKCPETTDGKVWITSAADSHVVGLHPHCRAIDVRTKNIVGDPAARTEKVKTFKIRLEQRLGKQFDVRLEDLGEANEHIHIELDEKAIG